MGKQPVIGLADTFMGHDRKEMVNIEDNNPSDDCPPQTVESVDLGTIKRKELIELQERQADLSRIQEQVVPEGQAGLSQVGYYKKSGVLMRQWRPVDASADETWRVLHQIVVPEPYRMEIIRLSFSRTFGNQQDTS